MGGAYKLGRHGFHGPWIPCTLVLAPFHLSTNTLGIRHSACMRALTEWPWVSCKDSTARV